LLKCAGAEARTIVGHDFAREVREQNVERR
jgi:hypothetical protein